MDTRGTLGIRLFLAFGFVVAGLAAGLLTHQTELHSHAQAGLQTRIFQQGVDGYTGCADTYISEEDPDTNFGDTELVLGMQGRASILARFDVSSIPTYAVVVEATFSLLISNFGQRDAVPIIAVTYPVSRTWAEMEATWYKATKTDRWGIPGCNDIRSDHSPVSTGSQSIISMGWYTWNVTSMVQHWVEYPDSNKGLVVKHTNLEARGECDIRSSEFPGKECRPRLIVKYYLLTPTPTNTPTNTPTHTPTNTPTHTPTHTPTNTPTHTPTHTPTNTPTNTPTHTPTHTSTNTPTHTPTHTPTNTPTPTPTNTPTPRPEYRVYLPKILKSFPLICLVWGNTFAEEFTNPNLAGWSLSTGGGQQQVSDSVLHLWTGPFSDRFPLLWRSDLFEGAGDDFAFEVRFRHSDFTAYGTTIALNSAPYDGTRVPAKQPLPPGIEDILNIHHVVDTTGNIYRFSVSLLGGRVIWNGTPGDNQWHILRVTLEQGNLYTLYIDGRRIGTARSTLRPISMYIGNPTIQPFLGGWTQLHVDYVRISRCLIWGPSGASSY